MAASWLDPDGRQGLLWALLGHAVLVVLILYGGFLLPRPDPRPALSIQATVVERKPAARRPAPKVEEPRPDPAEIARREEAERARVEEEARRQAQEAEQQKAEAERRARAEAERQAKAEAERRAKAAEAERQAKAEAERRAKAEAERQAKAEAERKAKAEAERKAREEAARKAKADAERRAEEARRRAAADLARELEEEEALLNAVDSGALDDYMNLINQKVKRNWIKPLSARPGVECEVTVTQIPGGEVVDVRIGRCEGDDALRRSVEAAFRKASPLPLPADPALFKRQLNVLFRPEE